MIKIKLSYKEKQEKEKIMSALKGLKVIHISKEYPRNGHKNIYINVE